MDSKEIIEKCIKETKRKIHQSMRKDDLLIQSVRTVEELNKLINALTKRSRDWYAFYNPETEHTIKDNEQFIKVITSKNKQELLKQLKIKHSMGSELEKEDLIVLMNLAKTINKLIILKQEQEVYQEKIIKEIAPNILIITGAKICAKLIEIAGSLERLSRMPSSTIQLLGAEQALFRHLKTGAKPPKYGILHEHPLISRNQSLRGKVARALADKICTAAKVDFFKGKLVGDKLKQDLEKKFGKFHEHSS